MKIKITKLKVLGEFIRIESFFFLIYSLLIYMDLFKFIRIHLNLLEFTQIYWILFVFFEFTPVYHKFTGAYPNL